MYIFVATRNIHTYVKVMGKKLEARRIPSPVLLVKTLIDPKLITP